jgi:chemotaxis protein CheC
MSNLTESEMDALKEVGNVGVGNAATALAKMISKKVDITIPDSKFIPIKRFSEVAGGAESVVNCIYVPIVGDITGEALLIFKEDSTKHLIDVIMGQPKGTTNNIGDMEISGFTEMANIVIGSYLSSMANMLSLKILPNPPSAAYDMLQSVIDAVLIKLSRTADEILYIKTEMSINEDAVDGIMVILFSEESLKKVLEKLKELYGLA